MIEPWGAEADANMIYTDIDKLLLTIISLMILHYCISLPAGAMRFFTQITMAHETKSPPTKESF